MPYAALQQMFDEGNAWGHHCYEKSAYLDDLTDGAIDVFTEHLPRKSSPLSLRAVLPAGRGVHAGSATTTRRSAAADRRDTSSFIIGARPIAELLAADRAWVRDVLGRAAPARHGGGEATSTT